MTFYHEKNFNNRCSISRYKNTRKKTMLKELIYKFSARNVSMSTFSGFNWAQDGILTSYTRILT